MSKFGRATMFAPHLLILLLLLMRQLLLLLLPWTQMVLATSYDVTQLKNRGSNMRLLTWRAVFISAYLMLLLVLLRRQWLLLLLLLHMMLR